MPLSDDQLRRAVDEVLDPIWHQEHRRARQHRVTSTVGRMAGGMLVLWALALVVQLVVGVTVPWVAFGFVTLLATVLAMWDAPDHPHLPWR